MKIKNKNLRKYLFFTNISFILLLTIFFWIFFYSQISKDFTLKSIEVEKKLESKHLNFLINEVNTTKNIIEILHENSKYTLKSDIKNSLDNVYSILNKVYDEAKKEHSKEELKKLMIETIKSFKNSKVNGYYFAADMDTTVTYVHARKDFIGKTMNEIAGKKATIIFDSYKKAIEESPDNGGFAYAKVAKPNTTSLRLHDKITYIKHFEPINVMIGIGVYLDDYIDFEKNQIFKYLNNKNNNDVFKFKLIDSDEFSIKKYLTKNYYGYNFKKLNDNLYEVKGNNYAYYIYNFYVEAFNWNIIITNNVSMIKHTLENSLNELKNEKKSIILNLTIITIILMYISFLISYYLVNKIDHMIDEYKQDLKDITEANKTNEILLIDSSKNRQTSIFVNSLIHQWYKPLNNFSLKLLNLKLTKAKDEKKFIHDFDNEIHNIEKSLDFISDTTQTFVDFFKDKNIDERNKINLYKFFNDFKFIFEDTLKMNNISFNIYIDPKSEIFSNENLLKQIFLSLISNSIEAFNQKNILNRNIDLYFSHKDNTSYVFHYLDTAGGIDENLLPNKLFEYNISTKKSSLGLGLYICKIIIKTKLKGNIKVKNNTQGAEFKIIIPM